MRNQHDADAGLALDITQQVEHLRLYGHIQRRSGFVGEEDVRVQGQRDGKHAPLAHPSGKIVRLQEHPLGRIVDAHAVEHLHGQFLRIFPAHFAVFQHGFRDLLPDGDRGVQRGHGVLKQHGKQGAAQLAHLLFGIRGNVLAVDEHFAADPGIAGKEFHDRFAQDGLAASGFAHDGKRFAALEGQRNVPDGLNGSVGRVEMNGNVFQFQYGVHVFLGAPKGSRGRPDVPDGPAA